MLPLKGSSQSRCVSTSTKEGTPGFGNESDALDSYIVTEQTRQIGHYGRVVKATDSNSV